MARRVSLPIALLILTVVVLLAAGCGARAKIATQIEAYKAQLADVRQQGAPICAPREYAAAEAHLDFAHQEWAERDYIEARDHLAEVQRQLDGTHKWLGNCVEKQPPDKDGDGILDDVDKCPDEPEDKDNFEDEDGCPDTDNDQDGILDADDKCPDEAGPKENDGCPVNDKDGDGVPDDVDKCPDTFGPKETDGCPQFIEVKGDTILLKQQIHFDTGRATIYPESFPILNEVAALLKANEKWSVRVEGHTDSTGSRATNMNLSQARAEACRDYLIQQGIAADRLQALGYGPDQPIASNGTPVGRAANRRTEFKIINK